MGTTAKVHISLFTVSLIYGATFSLAKEVMPQYIHPFPFIVLRVGTALILFLIFHFLFIREKVDRKDIPGLALSAVLGAGINMMMYFEGLAHTTPINASVLMLVTPVFVFIISTAVNREKLRVGKIAGIALAALGAMMLMGGKGLNFSKDTLYGDICIILNALSFAIYLVYVKKFIKKYNPITVSKWNFIFGFLFVLPFGASGLGNIVLSSFTPFVWFCVVFILIGTTFLVYLLNAWALQHAPSTLVGSYIYLQPVIASIIALSVGKDVLTVEKVIFILLIFAGVYLVSLTPKTKTT